MREEGRQNDRNGSRFTKVTEESTEIRERVHLVHLERNERGV